MRRQSDLSDIYGVKRIQVNPLDKDNDVPETGFRHSDAYHRFFRGYTEIRREKPNGRYGVERYYTQPWIVSTASDRAYLLTRLMYVTLLGICWILYTRAMGMDLGSNRVWFVAIPGFSSVILLVVLSIVVLSYCFVRRKMTLWDFESCVKRLKTVSLLTGSCMVLTAVAKMLCAVVLGGNMGGEAVSVGITALAAAGVAAIYLTERAVVYTTVPNETVLPEGEAHEIW